MASGLPELTISAVEYVAADGDYTHVLLDYVSELLLRAALPQGRQLGLHAVAYAVLYQCVAKIHARVFLFVFCVTSVANTNH